MHITITIVCLLCHIGALSVPYIGDQGIPSNSISGDLNCVGTSVTSQPNESIHVFDTLPPSASLSLKFSRQYPIFCAFFFHYMTNKLKLSFPYDV